MVHLHLLQESVMWNVPHCWPMPQVPLRGHFFSISFPFILSREKDNIRYTYEQLTHARRCRKADDISRSDRSLHYCRQSKTEQLDIPQTRCTSLWKQPDIKKLGYKTPLSRWTYITRLSGTQRCCGRCVWALTWLTSDESTSKEESQENYVMRLNYFTNHLWIIPDVILNLMTVVIKTCQKKEFDVADWRNDRILAVDTIEVRDDCKDGEDQSSNVA